MKGNEKIKRFFKTMATVVAAGALVFALTVDIPAAKPARPAVPAAKPTPKSPTSTPNPTSKPKPSPKPRSKAIETFTVNGVTFEMVRVEGGTFQMGSWDGDSDERPVHAETVETFYIGRTPVTQRLWVAVMGENPSYQSGENDLNTYGQHPVDYISWYDCQEFIERLSRKIGRKFRLPTEAEWEYAARGGKQSHGYIYSGSNDIYRVGWFSGNSQGSQPVAQKLDNELGLYDMSGNVWEWCQDYWRWDYDASFDDRYRVLRGGGWDYSDKRCEVSHRLYNRPDERSIRGGMRLAL